MAGRAWFKIMRDGGELPGQVRERLARETEDEIEEAKRREEQLQLDHEQMRVEREKRKADAAAQAKLDRWLLASPRRAFHHTKLLGACMTADGADSLSKCGSHFGSLLKSTLFLVIVAGS